ncbi:MAG TPA: type II secretion system minor pseudopilin GspK [Gammaproteobacteria bacterium]
MKPINRQSGVALITALFIFALVTIAAVAMADRQTLDIRRTENMLHSDQAYMYALAAEITAKQALIADDNKDVDHEKEPWALPLAEEIEGGTIAGFIRDATARFPINNLVNANGEKQEVYVMAFQRFVDYVTSGNKCGEQGGFNPDLANVVLDWLDKDEQVNAGGAEDAEYLRLERPYRAANQSMASISELRPMSKIIAEEYNCFVGDGQRPPLVNAINAHDVAINVNTAPPEILQSIHPKIDDKILQLLIEGRGEEGYKDITSFVTTMKKEITFDPAENNKEAREFDEAINKIKLSVGSQYFEVTATAQIGRMQLTLMSLLKRDGNKVATVQRSIGVN